MDGLIINSEPLWRKAEIKIFRNIGLDFTEDMCRQTMGMRIDEVVKYWHKVYQWDLSNKEIENNIVEELISLVLTEGSALPGIIETIENLKRNNFKLAIASSSNMRIIETVIHKLNLEKDFDIIHSAEFEKFGKPHPDVFLTTAKKLAISPEKCLVFEDSKHGMDAAIAAQMKVIIIPENPDIIEDWYNLANKKLNSMKEFNLSMLEHL